MRFREMRWPCNYEALVMLNGAARPAQIINISEGGARIRGLEGLAIGNRLILRFLNRSFVAEVRWIRGGLCGVRFTVRLSTSDLAQIRQGVLRAATGARSGQALREIR